MKKIIKGKGYTLRLFRKSDYKSLANNINDKEIFRQTLHIPYPYRQNDAKKWLKRTTTEYQKKPLRNLNLAIEINGEVSGCISLRKIEKEHKAELGYWLARKHWGKGIMSRAVLSMTNFAFNELKLRKVYACVFTGNIGSAKVLTRNSYKKERLLKKHVMKGDKLKNEYLFSKIK